MHWLRVVRRRLAHGNYHHENLDPTLIDRLLEVAWHAPRGRNDRRLLFSVVDDRKELDRICEEVMAVLAAAEKFPPSIEFFADIVKTRQTQKIDILFRPYAMPGQQSGTLR